MNKKQFCELYTLFVFETEPGDAIYLDGENLEFMEKIFDSYRDLIGIELLEITLDGD